MGPYSYHSPRIQEYTGDTGRVVVGAYTSVARGVEIWVGGEHPVHWVSTYGMRAHFKLPGAYQDGSPSSRGDVVIGNDVWIGRGARIFSGVTIGDGAVVGGYSVVRKDIAPYAIVTGNPATERRKRFTEEQIAALLKIAWWNWDHQRVLDNVAMLNGADVDDFISAFLEPDT